MAGVGVVRRREFGFDVASSLARVRCPQVRVRDVLAAGALQAERGIVWGPTHVRANRTAGFEGSFSSPASGAWGWFRLLSVGASSRRGFG